MKRASVLWRQAVSDTYFLQARLKEWGYCPSKYRGFSLLRNIKMTLTVFIFSKYFSSFPSPWGWRKEELLIGFNPVYLTMRFCLVSLQLEFHPRILFPPPSTCPFSCLSLPWTKPHTHQWVVPKTPGVEITGSLLKSSEGPSDLHQWFTTLAAAWNYPGSCEKRPCLGCNPWVSDSFGQSGVVSMDNLTKPFIYYHKSKIENH